MDLKYIYHGNMVSRPTTFLEVLHCWSLFWWNYCKIWFFPYVPVSDVLLLWSPQPVFFFLFFCFLFCFSYQFISVINHFDFDMAQPWVHVLTRAISWQLEIHVNVYIYIPLFWQHIHLLSRSLCSYSQCDQNRDEFVFYFILIFTTSSVSSTPHLSALFNCYVNSVRIVTISCQNLSS